MGRSRATFVAGLVVFVVGAATAAYFAFREQGGEPDRPTVQVLVAVRPIPAGTTGSNAAAQGLVERRSVDAATRPENALTEVSQLAGKVSVTAVAAGQILTADQFPQAQTRIGTVRIPEDKTALALALENVPGVAGFAGAGDRIDIYAVVRAVDGGQAGVRLILQGIEVLSVNGTQLAPTQGQPGGAGLVFLLAVTPAEAERLIYLTSFERLYFSLVPRDQPPVPPTPGAGPGDVLRVA
jgi:Flp pilus assembly protein CpaB